MKSETVKRDRRNNVFLALKKLYAILNKKQRTKFLSLIVSTFVSSLGDLIGLGMVIPIVGLVLSPTFHAKFVAFFPFTASLTKEHLLLYTVAVFFLLIIAKNLFGLYINYLQVKFVRNMFVTSTENVLNKVYKKSLTEIQDESSNTWVNKVTQMQAMLCSNMAISVMIVINEAIVFVLTAVIVCLWNWHLFLLLIAVLMPTVGLFYYRVKGMIKTAGHEKNNKFIQLYAKAQEMIFGYTDIKIAGTEPNFKKRFNDTAVDYSKLQSKVDFTLFVPTRLIEIAIFLCIIIILLYGVYVIKDINTIVTTITLFSVIAYRSIPSVNRFIIAMNNVNAAEFVLEDEDFMPEEAEEEDKEAVLPISFQEKIRFDHVSFRYAGTGRNVLNNCNLVINKGEKIGIVGKSGTGKSTLVNNILGFLSPTSGGIFIDNAPLNGSNIRNWWKIVGYVRQDAFILNATLAENIALGETPEVIDYPRLQHAIKMSSLSSLITELPEGEHTLLSERGNNLSGGQKQRIAIARAIYKGAQVLVFDEATSALDTKTEEEITDAINELGKENLTIIIIAHRHTSLRFCEKIYQIDNGKVSDTFSYQDLLSVQNR
jgi:ABC-type bacteriocin/lantibiotic exporter with double-glycine peptidase domain